MKTNNLKEAIQEAKRFLQKANELKSLSGDSGANFIYGYNVESAAVKRSSMDLTRALAKLRNDNN